MNNLDAIIQNIIIIVVIFVVFFWLYKNMKDNKFKAWIQENAAKLKVERENK